MTIAAATNEHGRIDVTNVRWLVSLLVMVISVVPPSAAEAQFVRLVARGLGEVTSFLQVERRAAGLIRGFLAETHSGEAMMLTAAERGYLSVRRHRDGTYSLIRLDRRAASDLVHELRPGAVSFGGDDAIRRRLVETHRLRNLRVTNQSSVIDVWDELLSVERLLPPAVGDIQLLWLGDDAVVRLAPNIYQRATNTLRGQRVIEESLIDLELIESVPVDVRVLNLVDDPATIRLLADITPGRRVSFNLQDPQLEALTTALHEHRGGWIVTIGHIEDGFYVVRSGAGANADVLFRISITDLQALAERAGTRVIHLGCNTATSGCLGILGTPQSTEAAAAVVSSAESRNLGELFEGIASEQRIVVFEHSSVDRTFRHVFYPSEPLIEPFAGFGLVEVVVVSDQISGSLGQNRGNFVRPSGGLPTNDGSVAFTEESEPVSPARPTPPSTVVREESSESATTTQERATCVWPDPWLIWVALGLVVLRFLIKRPRSM